MKWMIRSISLSLAVSAITLIVPSYSSANDADDDAIYAIDYSKPSSKSKTSSFESTKKYGNEEKINPAHFKKAKFQYDLSDDEFVDGLSTFEVRTRTVAGVTKVGPMSSKSGSQMKIRVRRHK